VFVLVAGCLLFGGAVILAWPTGSQPGPRGPTTAAGATGTTTTVSRPRRLKRVTLVERSHSPLSAPLQDASSAQTAPGRALLLGGLTQADTSTDAIIAVTDNANRQLGRLPTAVHDTAAARIGRYVYLFGGGTGIAQLDSIVRVDPASGSTVAVGRLPAPSSDQSAAALGRTAYVVGGYTGTRWLDTVVAWRPGSTPRVVARLPSPVRYAAVTAVDGALVIAGGSLPDGSAGRAVYAYRPGGRVVRIGSLPAPTTHAAAAALAGTAYVIGGRGGDVNTPTARIVAIDPVHHKVGLIGHLRTPLSDLAVVNVGGRLLVAGGRSPAGTVASVTELRPRIEIISPAPRSTAIAASSNVYARDGADMLTGAARFARPLIYVPNSQSGTVDVIDPRTFKVVEHFAVGALPQHVVPAWNLRTLYVTNDLGNSLTTIDPRTGTPGKTIPVDDPYNMYFTTDGRDAIVVAERLHRLDFRNSTTFRLHKSLTVPCLGVDHIDFSADGSYLLASCEFSGQILKVDVRTETVVGVLDLPDHGAMPQDVKLSPDGKVFYVADMQAGGIWEIDGQQLKVIGFLHTGAGAHGLYPSRNARYLYVTNRSEGSISVISFATRKQIEKWWIPGGGSPDMGGVSADGAVLWLSGRYSAVVYAIATRTGKLLARIPVGAGPHGLCVWPQPGRYSLGHTGILR
jgi:DNA-binding beta-propeller fold protein YncE